MTKTFKNRFINENYYIIINFYSSQSCTIYKNLKVGSIDIPKAVILGIDSDFDKLIFESQQKI